MKSTFPGFAREALQFLRDLEENNHRDWFQPRKEHFEKYLKEPMQTLVATLNNHLSVFAPDYVTDPKKAVFRIYRDTRFSHDKTPYKTNLGASFGRHGMDGGAGFYFSVSPTHLDIGGGLYSPPQPMLLPIRNHIADSYEELTKLLSNRTLKKLLGELKGEALTRPPKGFDANHPAVELLKKKGWFLIAQLDPALAETASLETEIASRFQALAPVLDYLNRPLLAQRKETSSDPLRNRR